MRARHTRPGSKGNEGSLDSVAHAEELGKAKANADILNVVIATLLLILADTRVRARTPSEVTADVVLFIQELFWECHKRLVQYEN